MTDQTRTISRCLVLGTLLLGGSAGLRAQAGPPAAIAVVSGSGQRTGVDEFFPNSLVALVTDASGNPVPNATVNFAAPNSDSVPTCNFLDTETPVETVVTNSSGMAFTAPLFANGIAGGPYIVAATVAGAPGAANFSLTNFPSTANTTTTLSSSVNPSTLSQSVTLTANVTPAGATGSVIFSFGTILLGTVPLSGAGLATLTTTQLPAGSATLAAGYTGDSTHLPSASALLQTVNSAPASGFSPAIDFAIGPSPGASAIGDFNSDGIGDIAVVNGGNQVTVLLSNGSGGFVPAPNSPFAAPGAQSVAVGDFNGDGKADLAVAESTGNAIAVLFGDGHGGFTQGPVFSLPANASPVGLAVADFNGDGLADLAVADSGTNDVAILLGNGAGGFAQAPGSPFPAGQTPSAVAVGDFNGDGLPDVAVASTGSNDVTILLGIGTGGFTPAPGSPVPADGFPTSIAVGDFDGDGITDLAVANASGADVTVILGSVFGTLAQAPWSPVAVGQAPFSITAGDFNGDGNLDFSVANYTNPGTASVFLGNGNGGFNNEGFGRVGARNAVRAAAARSRRKKSRDFTPAPEGPVAVGANPISIAAADFNGDGKTDLAVVNATDNNVSVLFGVQSPTLKINAACPATVGVVDQEYSFSVSASGGVSPLSWTQTAGNLPDELQLNQQTGVISGFSFETGTFPITVTVSDSGVGALQQTATYQCNIVISALPVLSAAPAQISFTSLQGATPATQSVNVSTVGQSVAFTAAATVNAFAGVPWLGVTVAPPATTNEMIILKVSNPPPGAPAGAYTGDVTISAPAANNPTVTVPVTWTVIPLLAVTATCPATGGIPGLPYSFAVGVTGGSPPYNWALTSGPLPPGLTLNTATGVISGSPSSVGVFPIAVQITDSGRGTLRQSVSYNCSITIVTQPTITAACPATGGVQGSPYSFTIGVAGGGPQYTWTLTGGSLPPGLSLNTGTGVISGTPLRNGTFPITVQINSFGAGVPEQSVTYTCSIVIAPQLKATAVCPLNGAQGSPYSFVVAVGGGAPPYTWILSNSLPPGLQLNSSSGLISGIPTTAGTFPIAISISDSGVGVFHQTVTYNCTVVITPPTLALTSACPGSGIEGLSYGPFNLSASGGLGPGSYVFSINNGSLPTGVTLTGNLIGGTPSGPPGTSNFSIQVNSGNQTASTACSVTIGPALPALQIGGTCPPNSIPIGTAVTLPLSATGGKAPYTFRLTSGPSWLTLSSQGSGASLAGQPSTAGSFPFSVTLTDSVNSKPAIFSCTIIATSSTLKVNATCPGPQIEEVAFSIPLAAGGGQGPYNWSYSGPSWLTLASATGAATSLSGTPPQVTGPQTFPFTVTLNDSVNSAPATFTCTVTVNPPPLKIAASGTCPTAALARPASFSMSFTASGGNPPYTWSLAAPSWLTLSAATGTATSITGAPSADGNFPFTLTLQDSAKTAPATFGCTLSVSTPIPQPSVSAGPAPPTLQDPLTGGTFSLSAPTPVQLTGEIQLTFTPDAFGVTDNPQVQFSPPGEGRTFQFTIPAGSETIPLPSIQQGDVAGTIHLELVSLLDGTRSVLPESHPSADYTVPRVAPVITDLELQNQTSSGFTIVVAGYSTPRDMSSVTIVFTAAAGATINGTAQFTISLNDIFTTFYQSANSAMSGSAFTNLQIPVTIQGDISAIGSVGVSLTNSIGTSSVVSKSP